MIKPHRRHVVPNWVVRERPATLYPTRCTDNKETDIKADASTRFLSNTKSTATVGQTGVGNANMELHLITSEHLQLDHKQPRGCI